MAFRANTHTHIHTREEKKERNQNRRRGENIPKGLVLIVMAGAGLGGLIHAPPLPPHSAQRLQLQTSWKSSRNVDWANFVSGS